MPRKMKDSGIEWIGEIPESWSTTRIKYVAEFEPKCDTSNLDADSVITYTPMECVKNGYFENRTASYGSLATSLTPFQEGDVAMAKVTPCFENGNIAVMSNLSSGFGLGSSELFVFRPISMNTRYLFYWLQNQDFIQKACSTMTGTGGLKRVSPYFVKNCEIHLPPPTDQTRIASYLDTQCARIDAVLEQTRNSIEEYKKLKQSVITQAVTKGIRPGRKLKDSGIEWIGEIPEEWEVLSFTKSLCSVVDYRGKTPEKQDQGTLLVTARNIKDGKIDYEISREYVRTEDFDEIMHRGKVEIGDVLFTTEAPLGAVANADQTHFALAQRIIKFRGIPEKLNNYYLKYWIMTSIFQQNLMTFSTGSTAKGIKASKLGMLKQILPPLLEQEEIVRYLNTKTCSLDELIKKKQLFISTLESYKKSLIYECVTGKREVI